MTAEPIIDLPGIDLPGIDRPGIDLAVTYTKDEYVHAIPGGSAPCSVEIRPVGTDLMSRPGDFRISAAPVDVESTGPVSSTSYPCARPRWTTVETSWDNCEFASMWVPAAASSRAWASEVSLTTRSTDD